MARIASSVSCGFFGSTSRTVYSCTPSGFDCAARPDTLRAAASEVACKNSRLDVMSVIMQQWHKAPPCASASRLGRRSWLPPRRSRHWPSPGRKLKGPLVPADTFYMNVCSRTQPFAAVAIALSLQFTAAVARSQTAAAVDAQPVTQDSSVVKYLRDTFSFSGEFRSRLEGGFGNDFALTPRDVYVLTRTRLGLAFKPTSWLRFYGEAQDARAMFYKVPPGASVDDPFDWRQGWVEIGHAEGPGMRLRVGRQEMTLGSGRLVGSGDWTNVTKTFNVARATITQTGFKVDLLAGSVVAVDTTRMDRAKPGEHFYGTYMTLSKVLK